MATDRDDLAALLRSADAGYVFEDQRFARDIPIESYKAQADAIIAAGWTPPMSEREHAWGRAAQERITREQGKELPEEDGNGNSS